MRPILAILLLILASAAPAEEKSTYKRLDIKKPTMQWEALPHRVKHVFAAPDGRIWYQCEPIWSNNGGKWSRNEPTLPELKRRIEEEFRLASPQIVYDQLLLLEPGGRVWLYVESHKTILGYDGREWITRAVDDPQMYPVGRCATRGALFDAYSHRFAGGTAWFIARGGIHRFDGETWSFQPLKSDKVARDRQTMLSVSADGKRAVAHRQDARSFWIFREGAWTKHEVLDDSELSIVTHLAIGDAQTVWYALRYGRLRHCKLGADGRLLPVKSAAEALGKSSNDVLEPFGTLRAAKVGGMLHDDAGNVYLVADGIDDGRLPGRQMQPGVAVLRPDGGTRILPGREHAGFWIPQGIGTPTPIVTASGNRIWLPGDRFQIPALLDLEHGGIADRLPQRGPARLEALTDDSLFVSRYISGRFQDVVNVYSPSAPRPEPLESLCKRIGKMRVMIGGDGAVWTFDSLNRLVRFHQGDWSIMQSRSRDEVEAMLPGHGSVMLIERKNNWTLFHDGRDVDRGSMFELMERHHELIGKAFAPGAPPPDPRATVLIGSPGGQVWYLKKNNLWLFEGNQWRELKEVLKDAGSRSGWVAWAAPVGDGRQVYLRSSPSRVIGLKEGRFHFESAPSIVDMLFDQCERYLGVRDSRGTLFLPIEKPSTSIVRDFTLDQVAVSPDAKRIAGTCENGRWARLVDPSDNVWLERAHGKSTEVLNLWHDGEFIQQISVPAYEGFLLFSDRPGSVYAHTTAGLHHLVADPPDFRRYRLGKLHGLPETIRGGVSVGYSKQGYVVFMSYGRSDPLRVHLVKLPSEDGEGDR